MNRPLRIRAVSVIPLNVPMRFAFEHAAATRAVADPVIVRLTAEAPHAQLAGYGETLARRYVTGESADTVCDDVLELFMPHLLELRAESFSEVVGFANELPSYIDGRLVNAARCAVELALLDLAGKFFRRRLADVCGWLDLAGFQPPGCLARARYSGMAVGGNPRRLRAALYLQRLYGLRDFKIKVAVPGWRDKLETTRRTLARGLASGKLTLRADANGAWDLDEALAAVPVLESAGVSALEQPLPTSDDDQLAELARNTTCDLIADESLLTLEDAEELIGAGAVRVLNIRLAKNGGLLPAVQIARLALSRELDVQLGCLVGETSLLAAAGAAFLELCPRVRFVEGAYAGYLLRGDAARRPVRFGFGGRMSPLAGHGLGVAVDEAALRRFAASPEKTVQI